MATDVISGRTSSSSSSLNPNAPMFVPLAYRTVEDFSDQWWALVQSSPWFRDYWLQERFCDPQSDPSFLDFYDPVLPELDSLFDLEDDDSFGAEEEVDQESDYSKEVVRVGSEKWRKNRVLAESPRYMEKAPKILKPKLSPRSIQQPR